jgi:PAS domain S-box-containing protein
LTTKSFPKNITNEVKVQTERVLELTKKLCAIQDVFLCLDEKNEIYFVPKKPLIKNVFFELHGKVMQTGQQQIISKPVYDLTSFYSLPIINSEGNILGSICLVDKKKISLDSFQTETLDLYVQRLVFLLSPSNGGSSENNASVLLNSSSPYFFKVNQVLEVMEVGVNFQKSIPEIKSGDSLFKYFQIDKKDTIEDLKIEELWFSRMHFLDLRGLKQRYKFTAKESEGSIYILAAPIINSKFALKSYNVNVNDFPLHDTIAEYLFLEQTSRKSLEESRIITQNIIAKNKEIVRIQKEYEAISKFPEQNPNPILRFDLDLNLVYYNAASEDDFLSDFEINKGYLGESSLRSRLNEIITSDKRHHHFFIDAKSHYYSVTIALITELGYLNIYAHDITGYRERNERNQTALKELNTKVETQREFYEFILNNLPADVAVFDKNHKYVFINPKGIQDDKIRDYMIGKDDYDYCRLKGIPSEMADDRRALFNEVLRSKKSKVWVDDLINKEGIRNVIHRTMGPLFDEKGEVRFVIGYGTEITQRVTAEEENVRLSLVAKNTNNGVLMLDTEMMITWANQAMIDRSGYSLEEMQGRNPREFISNGTESQELKRLKEAIKLKQNVEVEMLHSDKSGSKYYVSLNLQPLFDANNMHSGFMMVEFDITERISSEKTIQNLNVNLERLVQEKTAKNMELASSLRDQEKMVTIGELASGVAHDLNTPLGAIKSGTENVSYTLDVLFKKLLPQSSSEDIEYAFNRASRSDFELFVGGVQMLKEQREIMSFLTTQDSGFSNDQLNDIAILMVKARVKPEDSKEIQFILKSKAPLVLLDLIHNVRLVFSFIKTISTSGDRATEVIQNLRLFIREKRNAASGNVNIKNNINTVLNVFSHKIKNIVELTFDIDSSINIKGYDVRLFQLWSNLIKNALESMEDQQGLKTLKLYSETTKDDYFITVENNGPEISEKNQVKIFNKFFTTKGKKKGSGLGLNIVKNVLEEHQGRVVLESNPNFTRFIINFKRDK